MGMIKLSQKVKRSPVVGFAYWAGRGMAGFMPSVAYDVPIEGGPLTTDAIVKLQRRIAGLESDLNPFDQIGVHIEVHDQGYITVTIGAFAT